MPLRKPLQMENGGLGYYDLESFETRKQQAQLAREHGVSGFMYYHYWFSGKGAPKDHVVMQKIPELMLKDGPLAKREEIGVQKTCKMHAEKRASCVREFAHFWRKDLQN